MNGKDEFQSEKDTPFARPTVSQPISVLYGTVSGVEKAGSVDLGARAAVVVQVTVQKVIWCICTWKWPRLRNADRVCEFGGEQSYKAYGTFSHPGEKHESKPAAGTITGNATWSPSNLAVCGH